MCMQKNMHFVKTKIPKIANPKNSFENLGTCQQFSIGNPKISFLDLFASKKCHFQNSHAQKKQDFLSKNSKIEKSKKQRRKHRDASTIFSRKSRNRTFRTFSPFFRQNVLGKFWQSPALSRVQELRAPRPCYGRIWAECPDHAIQNPNLCVLAPLACLLDDFTCRPPMWTRHNVSRQKVVPSPASNAKHCVNANFS